MQLLFTDFLSNPRAYRQVQAYWKLYFDYLGAKYGFQYAPYLPESAEQTGNPIFNAYVAATNKAVRIIQIDPEDVSEDHNFEAWVDLLTLEEGAEPLEELVLHLMLNPTTELTSRLLIQPWLSGKLSYEELSDLLEDAYWT